MTDDRQTRHRNAMRKLKSHVDEKVAAATEQRGLLLVFTGNGKGKTTAAWGTVTRSLGYGYRVGVVQFIKGMWECGERERLADDANLSVHVMATGFTWDTQNREADTAACQAVWRDALTLLQDPDVYLVVLDEITYMLKFGYLDIASVREAIANRPSEQTVIVTGRNAHRELLDMADTVTEMQEVRHAFNAGVQARRGIDY
ncbi:MULTISPECIES: cob(I)yrinic acid a,c-diamide adenosyltransferase [Chromohalobacter]|uniref:Corrinoid adenosyltransferase n=1 Tax=Chromohalobacter israelensis (strain ATCC BAA-138 / DSM 3043 / CIP 106854 / NCIMB 13768 / 1H11) TaxID=290398 RepID=Q1QXG2_CHRI1|nr:MULTISPECIES: cob(I)yrinic acid a,c-diamide adenosyltransferase [Chromohalobacter]ABE58846.1 cob(I)yrinic acid a,c-diamide adenosyltransferase [Chromohalobacter salexigens DSM 3043]MBZ5877012.1 cob(I)yrinic acid a,c-diamide adenosyltransferase [Chromohalobacter salexigens]MDF9433696.1 cob(I)yrinic acid a,c-diamide adenosyltransferase [Chromohalobacter israelensis]MDO0944922.1 cob(I)yrinic acid a,c-diamide adenosyltransferase [Chromohalobacter salexigens]NQY44557.1 cob(I)yrinic acid a,c-diam